MHIHAESLFLIQALIIIVIPLLIWRPHFIKRASPLVMVQILTGIALGPTVLGHFLPSVYGWLFPKESLVSLNGLSWTGLSLLGFLTGLHFDTNNVRKKGGAFLLTSASTLIVPFILGGLLALGFYHEPFVSGASSQWIFVAGVATAIAVTAIPVLSAILIELKIIDTSLGRRVLGYAIINDIALWVSLAVITAFSSAGSSDHKWRSVLVTVVIATMFIVVMNTLVKRFCQQLSAKGKLVESPSSIQLVAVLAGILVSGLITESIGIHFLLGAFVFGSIMPKQISHGLYHHFEQFTMIVLMPFFFVLTGLKISLSFGSGDIWLLFAAATIVAILGKVIGTALPEYWLHKSSKTVALQAGTLMQTKGLMEVVVLNVLLTAGIINNTVFSSLVLMAVATTLLTKPILNLINRLTPKQT